MGLETVFVSPDNNNEVFLSEMFLGLDRSSSARGSSTCQGWKLHSLLKSKVCEPSFMTDGTDVITVSVAL